MSDSGRTEKRVPYAEFSDADLRYLVSQAEREKKWGAATEYVNALARRAAPAPPRNPKPAVEELALHRRITGRSKLSEKAVRAIRASDERASVLARSFGVSRQTVSNVLLGKTYRDVS